MPDLKIRPYSATVWYTIPNVPSLTCNWEINRAGMLYATFPAMEISKVLASIQADSRYSRVNTLAGMTVLYEDQAAGNWGGIVMQVGASDGMAQISAMSYEILLRKTLVSIDTSGTAYGGSDNRGHPGKVLRKVIGQYNGTEGGTEIPRLQLIVGSPFTDSGTTDVQIKSNDVDAYNDIIPQITEDIGWEWNVDASRTVTYDKQLGSVKNVVLAGSKDQYVTNVSAASWQDDFYSVTNSLRSRIIVSKTTGKGKKQKTIRYPEKSTKTDSASALLYGILREFRDYPNIDSMNSLNKQLNLEIETLKDLRPLITVEVPNVDNVWSKFRHGDTVNLQLGSTGYSGTFRVMVRSLDTVRGVMVCSGYGDKRTG